MNIEEYADALNLEIEIVRYANQGNRYSAKFSRCETKDNAEDGFLTGTYGNGSDSSAAIADYIAKIKGKVLVVDAGDKRREYVVPTTLSVR